MSLLLCYHDSKRALVCSDDLAVSFRSDGSIEKSPERVPKFFLVGAFIFAVLGRSDLCNALRRGTARLFEAHPNLPIVEAAQVISNAAKGAWARRAPAPKNAPLNTDALELAIIGLDRQQSRMRAFVLVSYQNNFEPTETTADPYARIIALGNYGLTDKPLLENLTKQMKAAEKMQPPWIAAQLRKTAGELYLRYPKQVGEPSFYTAIDRNGIVDLPEEFPLPIVEEAATAAHLMTTIKNWVTTNKETAFLGTTRFFLGSITTPAAGMPDTAGNNDGGTGSQYGQLNSHFLPYATFQNIANGGNATKGTEANIIDGNFSDSCSYTVTGNSSAANVAQSSLNPVPLATVTRKPQSITAKVLYDVTTNSLNGANGPSRFNIDITYIPAGGGGAVHNNVVILTQGQTAAKQVAQVSIPVGATGIAVNITANTLASDTAGSLTAHVYEFWADVVE